MSIDPYLYSYINAFSYMFSFTCSIPNIFLSVNAKVCVVCLPGECSQSIGYRVDGSSDCDGSSERRTARCSAAPSSPQTNSQPNRLPSHPTNTPADQLNCHLTSSALSAQYYFSLSSNSSVKSSLFKS